MRRRLALAGLSLALGALGLAPSAARADLDLEAGLAPPTCAIVAGFCGDFTMPGFGGWDGLNGNTSSAAALRRYFGVVPGSRLPVGTRYFRARVDENARDAGEPGQRTLVYLFPGRNRTAAYEGSDHWYHSAIAFPRGFRASPDTEWNWVVQWHNWPDGPCCANLALTVDTRGRGERLSLRAMGGGSERRPVDRRRRGSRSAGVRERMFVGDRRLRRGHWYDVLVHVRWSHRARDGLVEWWLDGRRVASARMATLFWYADNDTGAEGATPGPGRAYWMLGYYRPHRIGRRVDRSVASVLHNGARAGPTRASVDF